MSSLGRAELVGGDLAGLAAIGEEAGDVVEGLAGGDWFGYLGSETVATAVELGAKIRRILVFVLVAVVAFSVFVGAA